MAAAARTLIVVLACGAVFAAGCERPGSEADAELLVVTSDSTFWVTAAKGAVRAQGVPMLVARVDGRFTELYVADDDRSYYNAVFIGHRLFSRDLIRGDSVQLHRDTVITRLADEYARAHPDEQPLGPDDPENDDAPTRATSDLEILAVHGPYVSYEHHTDVDVRDDASAIHRHQYGRGVVDVRNGTLQSLRALFGGAVADSLADAGRREWRAARDTLIATAGSRGGRARSALAAFEFDAASFTLGSDGRVPTVRFAVPATGTNPDIEPVDLRTHRVVSPEWWTAVAAELPDNPGDDGRWADGRDTLWARADPATAVWTVALAAGGAPAQVVIRASSPVERVVWLDSTVSPADRLALRRAFAEAGAYDGGRQVATALRAQRAQRVPLAVTSAALHLPRHERFLTSAHRGRFPPRVVGADDAAGREHEGPRVWRRDPRPDRQDGRRMRDATRAPVVRHGIA